MWFVCLVECVHVFVSVCVLCKCVYVSVLCECVCECVCVCCVSVCLCGSRPHFPLHNQDRGLQGHELPELPGQRNLRSN